MFTYVSFLTVLKIKNKTLEKHLCHHDMDVFLITGNNAIRK